MTGVTSIDYITLEVEDPTAAERFYRAFGLGSRVLLRASEAPTTGFRGFTLSLLVSQPATVDALAGAALDAGATPLKSPQKQFWGGYSGVVQAPDGTIWKIATSSKKNTGPANREIDQIALLLGVADFRASKQFYVERGLTVAKSFARVYAEFAAPPEHIKLGLYQRRALAKDAGVSAEGSGSHRFVIAGDTEPFTDPDGFTWEPTFEKPTNDVGNEGSDGHHHRREADALRLTHDR